MEECQWGVWCSSAIIFLYLDACEYCFTSTLTVLGLCNSPCSHTGIALHCITALYLSKVKHCIFLLLSFYFLSLCVCCCLLFLPASFILCEIWRLFHSYTRCTSFRIGQHVFFTSWKHRVPNLPFRPLVLRCWDFLFLSFALTMYCHSGGTWLRCCAMICTLRHL
jgi:hypothetical protein